MSLRRLVLLPITSLVSHCNILRNLWVKLSLGYRIGDFVEEGPLWSCCWDVNSPHMLIIGSNTGKVTQYDRRMPGMCLTSWSNYQNTTPVVALTSVPAIANTPFPQGGYLSCRLNALFSHRRNGNDYLEYRLPCEGPFMSMRYDGFSQYLLTSSRPSSNSPYATIDLNQLNVDETGGFSIHQIHTFNCGSSARVMSRMTTVPRFDDTLVLGHHESGRTLNLWSTKTGHLEHALPTREPVIDVANMTVSSNRITFAALSEKKVSIYKVL